MRLPRMLQAEAAGRELMAALVRPDPYPGVSLGAVLHRLVGYLQTVLTASTPDDQIAPMLTVHVRRVLIRADIARLLRDAAILLVLAALDDGAQNVDVRLDNERGETRLIVESDRPAITADLPALYELRANIAAQGGTWETACATHGASWLVQITIPALSVRETSEQELVHDN
jgi:hypothetical protein